MEWNKDNFQVAEFEDGKINGKCIMFKKKGRQIQAEFKNGRLHGEKKKYRADGTKDS